MPESANTLKYNGLLLLTAAIWGFAFVAQRIGMEYLGPFTFNGVRFALGSLSLLPLIALRSRFCGARTQPVTAREEDAEPAARARPRKTLLIGGLAAGAVLFCGASLQQIGIVYTTAGKAGFITGLYVVLVPIFSLMRGQKAGWPRWTGVVLAAAGLYFLSMSGRFEIARGDFLVLLSAVFWAVHVHVLSWFSPRVDTIKLACMQYALCSVFSLTAAFLFEEVEIGAVLEGAAPILYGGFGSVGIAYTLQVVAQKRTHPTPTAIILSTEGIFAVLGGWLILAEMLSIRNFIGCVLILAGMLISQLRITCPGKQSER